MLCAGAAKGVVTALQAEFLAAVGAEVAGDFGAVGAMKARLLAGEPCDVIVVTATMIDDLRVHGHVVGDTVATLGRVDTGIAVRAADVVPDIANADALRRSLLAAPAVYVPDPERATAGVHFVDVLRRLAIAADAQPRLRAFASGAIAMRELAQSTEPANIGCTQVSEILYTAGVTLVGALPGEFALATVYAAAVCARAQAPALARRVVELLAGPHGAALREEGGFAT
jgi:molybdate transport system substrate-binding protein